MEDNIVKITGATYRLLETLPEGDPLKIKAKEVVLEILETKSTEKVALLLSYLEVAKQLGWVSDMNFLIVSKSYREVKLGARDQGLGSRDEKVVAETSHTEVVAKKPKVPKEEVLTSRQQKIVKILREKERAQVGDIIKKMPDITKRTIRRDLDDLLKKGKVVRTGQFNEVFYQMS